MKKWRIITVFLVLFIQLALVRSVCQAQIQAQTTTQTKDLAFVFLHGMGGNPGTFQLLSDSIVDKLPAYVRGFEQKNPDVIILAADETLIRQYPNYVDIDTWANNIATSINKYFPYKNLVLVGHSMGGKAALYMTAHNIGNISDRIAAVVTINSPVKKLSGYYTIGGANFFQEKFLLTQDRGVIKSLETYDASADGKWVAEHKHWLALCSSESSPMGSKFNTSGVDPLPWDMDDTIVPISAQYADGADVVYYGEHYHSEFGDDPALSSALADYILKYVFGDDIDLSVLSLSGSVKYDAGIFPFQYNFKAILGEEQLATGTFTYNNDSWWWQGQTFVVGEANLNGIRSSFDIKTQCIPIISGLSQANWLKSDEGDSRLVVRVRAAPRSRVIVTWSIVGYQPKDMARDRYEVSVSTGTPFSAVSNVTWAGKETSDYRLQLSSQAQGPLRWLAIEWKVYAKVRGSGNVIDGLQVSSVIASP